MFGRESAIEGFGAEEYGVRMVLVESEGSNILAMSRTGMYLVF